jgi:hypothetical protein
MLGSRPTYPPPTASTLEADGVKTTLNRVDEGIARREVRINRPSSKEVGSTANRIALGVHVEETNLCEESTRVVLLNGSDVDGSETGTVVGLEGEAVDGVLVVVDGLDGGFVDAAEDGPCEIYRTLLDTDTQR